MRWFYFEEENITNIFYLFFSISQMLIYNFDQLRTIDVYQN